MDPSLKYQVVSQLGSGKFSTVYKALDKEQNCYVALKKVQIYEMTDQKAREECQKEILLLQNLNHPNVCRYLSHFISQNELNIVLELADGGDLLNLLRKLERAGKRLSEGHVWWYFAQISAGLLHMHDQRIMHRDLKPANVFLVSDGSVKLGDLGLGRYFSSKTYKAQSLVGTPYYLSPERMHEAGYDFKSDIWSLGCILYELAVLRSPFYEKGLNLYGLCKKIDNIQYPALPSCYSVEMRDLISSMLVKDPKARPTTREVFEYASEMRQKHPIRFEN
eukprot:GCRY01004006.1.p1 GENE.GCRY01004006.1~~GCRY01004006.1.p1  ORF type:complete len:278 (+),score=19.34 GCRY01004006.1:154-987(+)